MSQSVTGRQTHEPANHRPTHLRRSEHRRPEGPHAQRRARRHRRASPALRAHHPRRRRRRRPRGPRHPRDGARVPEGPRGPRRGRPPLRDDALRLDLHPARDPLRGGGRPRAGATWPSSRRTWTTRYPLQFVPFADVRQDPGLHFKTGGENAGRTINLLLAKNVQAGRIVAGVTFSEPGHWTSWPPHEHSEMLEEAYLYVDMPAPAFGVQLVYTNPSEPELATIVHEGDVVLMPRGLSSERRGAGLLDRVPLDDGGRARGRGPPVRRRQRAARVRDDEVGARGGESEVSADERQHVQAGRRGGARHRVVARARARRWRRRSPRPAPTSCCTTGAAPATPRRRSSERTGVRTDVPRGRPDGPRRDGAAGGRGGRGDGQGRHPGEQRRDHPPRAGGRPRRPRLGRGAGDQPDRRVPAVPGGRRAMVARGHGKIVNVASLLSFQGGVTVPSYAAAKGGVAQITKALANEWAAQGRQRQRHCARLHADRQHEAARRGPGALPPDHRADPGRPLGRAGGPGRPGRLPRLEGVGLPATVTCWSWTAAGWDGRRG